MEGYLLFSILKNNRMIQHLGSLRSLALGPNWISCQCSAAVVIFSQALSLSEAAKVSNLYLQYMINEMPSNLLNLKKKLK